MICKRDAVELVPRVEHEEFHHPNHPMFSSSPIEKLLNRGRRRAQRLNIEGFPVPRYVGICAVLANWLIPSPLILGEALENPPFALDRQKKHVRRCFVAGCISMQGSKRDRRVYVRIICRADPLCTLRKVRSSGETLTGPAMMS
jgi:hypothetical protein